MLCSTVFAQNYDLNFDGTDYVDISLIENDLITNTTGSIESWVYLNATNYRTILGIGRNQENYFSLNIYQGIIRYFIKTEGIIKYYYRTGSVINLGEWHHIVCVQDGIKPKIFVDGIEMVTYLGAGNPIYNAYYFNDLGAGNNYYIGATQNDFLGSYWSGNLDEIRIWNTAIDQANIQSWMDRPLNMTHPNWSNLIGYWKFDEGSGQTVFDFSGNGNNGQLGSTGSDDANDPSWGLSDNPLPVELSSFTAIQTQADFAQINWTTQSETDLYGYNVYRSIESDINSSFKLNSTILEAENTTTGSNYSYCDENVEYEQVYFFWLESVDLGGNTEFFGPISITLEDNNQMPELPNETLLQVAYPNPFNPKTTINFSVKENETAQLNIYNSKGQIVKTYSVFENGNHSIEWLGKDNFGNKVGSGVFFYRLKSASTIQIKKMLLLK